MRVEFGRAQSGYVWHVVQPGSGPDERALCRPLRLLDVTEGQPPRGRPVCPSCARDVRQLARAVELCSEVLPA